MAHQVRINTLATACRFQAEHARKEVLRRAVDRTCREKLDSALDHALSPVLDGHDGVIRIRQIDLALTSNNPLSGDLAHLIAGRIAAMVRGHLHNRRDGVQSWPDHGHFIAHYALWRLGLGTGADWAFADFEALLHLSAQQAVVEVLGARPQALQALARDSVLQGAPEGFARALGSQSCVDVLQRISTAGAQDLSQTLAVWTAHRATLEHVMPGAHATPLAGQAVTLLVRMIAALPLEIAPHVPHVSLLSRLIVALAQLPTVALLSDRVTWAACLAAVQGKSVPETAVSLLREMSERAGGAELLDALAPTVAQHVARSDGAAEEQVQTRAEAKARSDTAQARATPAAGLALLLPSLVQLTAKTPLDEAQRHALALATLPADMRAEVQRHAGFLHLFPRNPQDPEPTDWPMPDLTDLPDQPWPDCPGCELWAAALMAHFADRLPGLGGSSRGYLQDQFLARTGDIEVTKTDVFVTLHRVPLGIVLSMGGHLGARGRIPWADGRMLNLAIKGGV